MIKIPDEFVGRMKELPKIEEMVIEFMKLKIFEHELEKSKELQRFILESLSAKSKLTLEEAMELGNKVKEGMLEELEEKGFKKQSMVKVFSTSDLISFLSLLY